MAKKQNPEEDDKKNDAIVRTYRDRLKVLRRAQEYSQADDIPKAVQCYSQYLNALASYHGVEEPKITPDFFDQESDIAELLLISHVYWDLAKAYDRSPNLHMESIRCLDQFSKFSTGYKYQYVNAQMVKNFIKKRLAHNPKAFKQTYEKIRVESKGCFIATHAFGDHAPETQVFRKFRNEVLLGRRFGDFLIDRYYQFSPHIVDFLRKYSFFNKVFLITAKPILKAMSILYGFKK